MTIDLYYLSLSPPSRAVILLTKALGIHLNLKVIDVSKGEQYKSKFIKVNPQHTVPTIDDNGFILTESRAIMGYLVDKYAKNDSLYPKDPKQRGIVDERLYFDLTRLYYNIFNAYIFVAFGMSNSVDDDKVKQIARGFEILNTYLENSEFVAGENLTIADFSIVISVGLAEIFGFDITAYDNVVDWYNRCKEALEKYGYEKVNAPAELLGEWFRANSQ
ncbi:glutathione S-transferase 1-1-like [Cotesia glomerata]|nr:glutathione S-transferase 1-1-like [Cotesia glomerata]XP_044596245.1 glutathione S-transferase 1-1-like [Cotesia glomerata]XP_044596246.1 glutathione S-transferase 1-1-like [Cotesia glomerata]XP_044596247.1 glutathione S-transferase 1-1-like [Cotesia glomerata]